MSADTCHKSALCLSLLLGALYVVHAGVASADMATVGSMGIVDTKDAGEIATDGVSATLSFAQPGQQEATIRYPVTLVPTPDVPLGNEETTRWKLTVRYQDGDPTPAAQTQRILVHLKELSLSAIPMDAGQAETVVTFDSNDVHPADVESDWQTKTVSDCRPFNPATIYFLEALFTSSATPTAPLVRLGAIVVAPEVTGQPPGGCE